MARWFGQRLEELRRDYESDVPLKQIAAKWKTSLGAIQRIVRRHDWPRRIPDEKRANMARAVLARLGKGPSQKRLVAWMRGVGDGLVFFGKSRRPSGDDWVPLYRETQP